MLHPRGSQGSQYPHRHQIWCKGGRLWAFTEEEAGGDGHTFLDGSRASSWGQQLDGVGHFQPGCDHLGGEITYSSILHFEAHVVMNYSSDELFE
jgi:hypothetical protein